MNPRTQPGAHRGLVLPRRALRRLAEAGIFAQASVSLEYQQLAKRYVVRGVESGGAVEGLGRYVTFCGDQGEPIPWLHPLDGIGVNGVHALVVAPSLVRVEMLRTGHTYELLITRYGTGAAESGRRPRLESQGLFRGVHGYLELELWGKDKERAGSVVPAFYSRGGEALEVPARFEAVTRALTKAVNCCGCEHAHYLVAIPGAAAADAAGSLPTTSPEVRV